MQLISWNVNSVRARLSQVMDLLQNESPDVLLLQETKCEDKDFPFGILESQGYNIKTRGQKTFNGVAILSKHFIEDIEDDVFDEARYISAFTNGYRVVSVYVPNGESLESPKFLKKIDFLKELSTLSIAMLHNDEKIILAGDFNLAPNSLDVYNYMVYKSGIFCCPQVVEYFYQMLHQGYIDPFRLNNNDIGPFSWWDYRGGAFEKNHGLRIDHILLSYQAADDFQSCEVLKEYRAQSKASDHAPLKITLDKG